jgi:hypothetical protein
MFKNTGIAIAKMIAGGNAWLRAISALIEY